jgi:predicted TIM-barrel enzyme
VKKFTGVQFLARLQQMARDKNPILMAGAANGLVAKFLEKGGVDILGVYNSSKYRMNGYGSLAGMLPLGNANEVIFEMGTRNILPQIKQTPVIAGVNLGDITMDIRWFLKSLADAGFAGVHNFPTVAWFDGVFRKTLEETGLGFNLEIEGLKIAKEEGLVTFGYAFNEEDTAYLVKETQVDVFVFHAGITTGGSTGVKGGGGMDDTVKRTQANFDVARKYKPDILLLAHGAALAEPEDARYIIEHTSAMGVQLGSGIERLAIEVPLEHRTKAFKDKMLGKLVNHET